MDDIVNVFLRSLGQVPGKGQRWLKQVGSEDYAARLEARLRTVTSVPEEGIFDMIVYTSRKLPFVYRLQ